MRVVYVFFIFFIIALASCSTTKSLNIPTYLVGKELKFQVFACDYTDANCRADVKTAGKGVGELRVRFLTDNLTTSSDESLKNDTYLGALLRTFTDVNALTNNQSNLSIWDDSDMKVSDYEETFIGDDTYILLFELDFKKNDVAYKQMLRMIFTYNQDRAFNALSFETGLDISNPSSVRFLYDTKDYPRTNLASFENLGRIFQAL